MVWEEGGGMLRQVSTRVGGRYARGWGLGLVGVGIYTLHTRYDTWETHPSLQYLVEAQSVGKRAVSILLECFLVNNNFYFGRYFTLGCAPDVKTIHSLPLKLRYKYFCRM